MTKKRAMIFLEYAKMQNVLGAILAVRLLQLVIVKKEKDLQNF
jgi:hypothetical protein